MRKAQGGYSSRRIVDRFRKQRFTLCMEGIGRQYGNPQVNTQPLPGHDASGVIRVPFYVYVKELSVISPFSRVNDVQRTLGPIFGVQVGLRAAHIGSEPLRESRQQVYLLSDDGTQRADSPPEITGRP